MLINTMILYLRDALPIFILLSLLASFLEFGLADVRLLLVSLAFGTVGALLVAFFASEINHAFDGAGMELLTSTCNLFLYFLISGLVIRIHLHKASSRDRATLVFGMILLVTSINGGSFLVFLWGYWLMHGVDESLIMGIALGLGISASFCVLLFFFVGWLRSVGITLAPHVLLILFASGQLGQSVNLLSQVDAIWQSPSLWNTGGLISDSSEVGHVLANLVGYDASPSLLQVITNLAAVVLPISLMWLLTPGQTRTNMESND